MSTKPIVIVGGGLAGLCCARTLHNAGKKFILLESTDSVGGRVRTDVVDGFRLDRGFQVFLTSYPEAKNVLDYDALELKPFEVGAKIRANGRFHTLADPWRRPTAVFQTMAADVGSLGDKLRIASLRSSVRQFDIASASSENEQTTMTALKARGFGDKMISRFFQPFYGGVFLERGLETSERMLNFTFRMFGEGQATLPADGMQAIPEQIAKSLPEDSIITNAPVDKIEQSVVHRANGETIEASTIIVATDELTASKLIPEVGTPRPPRTVTCIYFAATESPIEEPILVLNGEGDGPVNNFCVPSLVSDRYSPSGQHLLSASVIDRGELNDDELVSAVLEQLRGWFGDTVDRWRHLKTYHIPYALPDQSPKANGHTAINLHPADHVFLCGDYCENGSINGAMVSGRKAAEAVSKML